jgi:hypothetical protein
MDKLIMVVELPYKVTLGKNKRKSYSLNLNAYRNWQHYLKNSIKQKFHKEITPLLPNIRIQNKVKIVYEIYSPNKRRFDIMNVGSIVDKMFSDSLVEAKILPDDSYEYIDNVEVVYKGQSQTKDMVIYAKVYETGNNG